ncbi:MAG: hypothetical protein H6867_09460 [Rhodospirillales bacterium]|nr:hypothetical protein [Rhodospirillales bacterium]
MAPDEKNEKDLEVEAVSQNDETAGAKNPEELTIDVETVDDVDVGPVLSAGSDDDYDFSDDADFEQDLDVDITGDPDTDFADEDDGDGSAAQGGDKLKNIGPGPGPCYCSRDRRVYRDESTGSGRRIGIP